MEHKVEKAIIPTEVMSDIMPPTISGYTPTDAEIKLLRVLFDPTFMMGDPSVQKICDVADVSIQTYYNAIAKKGFSETIRRYAMDPCKGKAYKYVSWLEKYAGEGSPWHLKTLLALTDMYNEKVTVEEQQVRVILRPRPMKPTE